MGKLLSDRGIRSRGKRQGSVAGFGWITVVYGILCHALPRPPLRNGLCLFGPQNSTIALPCTKTKPYLAMPYPNRAKSPFSGSLGKISSIDCVRRRAADMVAEPHLSSPNRCDSASTWVSRGMMSVRRSMKSAHRPRSTGEPLRTIHRRNMQSRLHADWVSRGTTTLTPRVPK